MVVEEVGHPRIALDGNTLILPEFIQEKAAQLPRQSYGVKEDSDGNEEIL